MKKKSPPAAPQIIDTKAGAAIYRGAKGERLWDVNWVLGQISLASTHQGSPETASMSGVSGQIYKQDRIACTFTSKLGDANNTTKILVLRDDVVVRAKNPEATLLCDRLIYDGNRKFFRATGHARVLGTMGTVGTLDEVWASPDLTQVASPEMFNQPMKSLMLLPLALVGQHASMQGWTDGKGLTAKFRQSKMDLDKKTQKRTFTLVGNVSVVSEPQGLSLTSNSMNFVAAPDPKDPKTYLVQHAIAVGNVTILKTVTSATGSKTTRIDGSKGDYSAGTTESLVHMAGPTKIQSLDASKQQTMVATGGAAVAKLEPLKQSATDDALHEATLEGPVTLTLLQIDPDSKMASRVHATSNRMLLQNVPAGRRVTLTGAVHIWGDQIGEVTGANKVVFLIDKDGNWHVDTSGEQ